MHPVGGRKGCVGNIMKELGEHGSLTERFASVIAEDVAFAQMQAHEDTMGAIDLDLDAVNAVSDHLQYLAEEGLKRGIQVLVGMGDAANLGAGLRGLNGVASALQNLEKQKKREKQEAEERHLQNLLDQLAAVDIEIAGLRDQIEALDNKINVLSNVLQGLSDGTLSMEDALENPEVARALREWERRNPGKTFDKDADDAKGMLEEILAVQLGIAVDQRSDLERQLDGALERRSSIINEIDGIDNSAAPIEEKRVQANEISSQSYVAADTTRAVTTTGEIEGDAKLHQDGFRGGDATSQMKHDEAANEIDAMFGDDNALDFASAPELGNQFASAVDPSTDEPKLAPEIVSESTPKFETGLG